MNQSFNGEQKHYLPPINRSQSYQKEGRSQSVHDIKSKGHLAATPITRKLISTESLKNIDDYESMNEKDLLMEHENLLKVLKKYQQLIDISLLKKQKQKEREALQKSRRGGEKKHTKQQLMANEAINNKKIISNYLREIKELETAQKQRKLEDVLKQKQKVTQDIGYLKKQIFVLKNENNMAGRNLLTDRGHIEKQLNDAEKDLKIELTKNSDYKKRIQQLNEQLKTLKKQCENINIHSLNQQLHQKDHVMNLAQKRMEVEEAQRNYKRVEESIQEVMINKTKRNKVITKDIQNMDKRITELNSRIQMNKEKVARYQKVIQHNPK